MKLTEQNYMRTSEYRTTDLQGLNSPGRQPPIQPFQGVPPVQCGPSHHGPRQDHFHQSDFHQPQNQQWGFQPGRPQSFVPQPPPQPVYVQPPDARGNDCIQGLGLIVTIFACVLPLLCGSCTGY